MVWSYWVAGVWCAILIAAVPFMESEPFEFCSARRWRYGTWRSPLSSTSLGARGDAPIFPAQRAPSISIPHIVNVADGVSETEADHFTKCPGRRRCCFAH